MTLNVTVATPRFVIAATDRRLTDLGSRKVVTERSTKLTVVELADAIALISYNGIGKHRGVTPADWLLDLSARVRLPSLPLAAALELIREDTQRRLAAIPRRWRRHTFVVAAWVVDRSVIHLISNYERADAEEHEEGTSDQFTISTLASSPGREVRVIVTGDTTDFDPTAGRLIMTVASKSGSSAVDIKNLCVKAIVSAGRARRKGTVGTSGLWAVLDRQSSEISAGLDVPDGTTVQELPNFIQAGIQFRRIMVEAPRGDSVLWRAPDAAMEPCCPACGNRVPIGYFQCPICRGPVAPKALP